MVWPCEEKERGAHSERNDRCGHTTSSSSQLPTREKKKRREGGKPKMARCVMEEEANQIYRRAQMTGHARDEERRRRLTD